MKNIFITGATSGFGKACAMRFGEAGFRLVLVGRREERLKEIKNLLSGTAEVHIIPLDITNRQAVKDAIDRLPGAFSETDVLVNNAGLALGLGPFHEANIDDLETMIDTNIRGLVYTTRCILPGMQARNQGHIINIGSIASNWPYPNIHVYGATKSFVRQLSLNLRADLIGTSIRITNIDPGMAKTEFALVRTKGNAALSQQLFDGTDALLPEDIAEAVFWVASLPSRVNVNTMEIMPTCQAWSSLTIHREEE